MFVSYILRVRPGEAEPGHLTAQIEAVATGERSIVHSPDEIMGFITTTIDAQHATVLMARGHVDQ